MTLEELGALARETANIVRASQAPLLARIELLEERLASVQDAPKFGADDVRSLVAIEQEAHSKSVFDSLSGAISEVSQRVDGLKSVITDWPAPKNGIDGKSVTIEDVRPELERLVRGLPPAKDGEPGRTPSPEEVLGAVEQVLEPKLNAYALDFERRAAGVLERAVDRLPKPADGKDGKDGRDAFDLKDFRVEQKSARDIVLVFERGEEKVEHALHFDVVLDAGPYKTDQSYQKGDAVTFGGGLWIAQQDTSEKPQTPGSTAWRLGVRRGTDGKNGEKGMRGDMGPRGPMGPAQPIEHETNIR
jgi:hypothetical protein